MNYKELLTKILIKKAKGQLIRERTDEYNVVDGNKVLVKSRVVTKRSLPDVAAARALWELCDSETDVSQLTDEQLEQEKQRLLGILKDIDSQ